MLPSMKELWLLHDSLQLSARWKEKKKKRMFSLWKDYTCRICRYINKLHIHTNMQDEINDTSSFAKIVSEILSWETETCIWSAPNSLWLHLRASCKYLRETWTFPMPSSIIATFIYVAAVFGCESPQVKCKRYNARFTYLQEMCNEIKSAKNRENKLKKFM